MLLGSITGGEICENLKPLCLKILIQYHVKRLKKVTTKHGWCTGHFCRVDGYGGRAIQRVYQSHMYTIKQPGLDVPAPKGGD